MHISDDEPDVQRSYWRCGSQVGRTLYVAHPDDLKDPSLLFGLVDTPELAAHIVEIHNWWLDLVTEAESLDDTEEAS